MFPHYFLFKFVLRAGQKPGKNHKCYSETCAQRFMKYSQSCTANLYKQLLFFEKNLTFLHVLCEFKHKMYFLVIFCSCANFSLYFSSHVQINVWQIGACNTPEHVLDKSSLKLKCRRITLLIVHMSTQYIYNKDPWVCVKVRPWLRGDKAWQDGGWKLGDEGTF